MSDIKFSQLPNLATPDAATIIPVVASGVNYTVTGANLQTFVNTAAGNITAGNITVTGNVAGAYILGNGSQLTGLPATYGNANVAVFLPTYSGNLNSVTAVPGAAVTGTVGNAAYAVTANAATYATVATSATTANAVAGANVSGTVANAAYATAAGSATTATSATTAGTVTTAAQANITSVGTLTSLTATGNISANYFVGNGSLLTGISASSYGNANVAAFLPTYSGNLNSVTAVPGAAITGNVANATFAVSAGAATTATSAASATSALTAVTAGTVTTAAQANITSVGTLTSLAVTGNISGGNITTPGTVDGSNITTSGNVAASYYTGNGSLLTGVVSTFGGTLSGNLITGSNYIKQTTGTGGQVLFGSQVNVPGTSTFAAGLVTTNGAIEINGAVPNVQTGLTINQTSTGSSTGARINLTGSGSNNSVGANVVVSIANAVGLQINGANASAKIYSHKYANVIVAAAGARTLDGYLAVYIDGNVRYIPYYQ